jgi:ABC-2 type transport system ATP-binding protein
MGAAEMAVAAEPREHRPATAKVAIRTRGLEKRYQDVVAVRSLDLDVHAGEVFGLLGPNGAGKTTTILMLLGLTEPTSGTAQVLGLDPAREPLKVKRHVGYMPDNVGFYGDMTGRQNLRYTARLNGIERDVADERIGSLLTRVGLADAADLPVETYSRGMRQRLGLADALVKDPLVLILDEPTTAIDPVGVAQTLELVRELAVEKGVAVLLSSHLLHQVQQVCDRIAIFVSGSVVAQGTVRELAERQATGALVQIEIGADGEPAAVAATLRGVAGVTEVVADARDQRLWVVTGEPGIRPRVAEALVAAGQIPWQLRSRGMELDEIYQRYFETAAGPAVMETAVAAPAPAAPAPAATETDASDAADEDDEGDARG